MFSVQYLLFGTYILFRFYFPGVFISLEIFYLWYVVRLLLEGSFTINLFIFFCNLCTLVSFYGVLFVYSFIQENLLFFYVKVNS